MTMDKIRIHKKATRNIRKINICHCAVLLLLAALFQTHAEASAADLNQSSRQMKVIARLPLSVSGATVMFLRQQGGTWLLYVQRPSQHGFTVVDVTRPRRPRVVNREPLETITVMGSGLVATGTPDRSANIASSRPDDGDRGPDAISESVHALEVSDPEHLPLVQMIDGATSVLKDDARGLIYAVNRQGIWIMTSKKTSPLRAQPAPLF